MDICIVAMGHHISKMLPLALCLLESVIGQESFHVILWHCACICIWQCSAPGWMGVLDQEDLTLLLMCRWGAAKACTCS